MDSSFFGLLQLGVTLLQRLCPWVPDLPEPVGSLLDDHSLLRVGRGNFLRLFLKSIKLGLDGSLVSFPPRELPLQGHDFDHVIDFRILHDLFGVRLFRIKQFTLEWEDTVVVPADDPEPGHRQRLDGVSLRQDQSAPCAVLPASLDLERLDVDACFVLFLDGVDGDETHVLEALVGHTDGDIPPRSGLLMHALQLISGIIIFFLDEQVNIVLETLDRDLLAIQEDLHSLS